MGINDMNDQFDQTRQVGADAGAQQEGGEGVKQKARRVASQAQEKVTEQVREGIDTGRQRAAGTLGSIAQSLISSAEENEGIAGRYIERAGHQVERLSGYLENTDVRQLMAQTEGFARRQPLFFLGGAFALGLVAARFLKSSQRAQYEEQYDEYRRGGDFGNRMSDRELPVPGFREQDAGMQGNTASTGNTGMGNEAMPGGVRGSATGSPGFGTPASTGMGGMTGSTGTNPGTNPGPTNPAVGNTPGGNPISAAGRDFTDVDPTGGADTLQSGGESGTPGTGTPRSGTQRPGKRGTGSSSESDRY